MAFRDFFDRINFFEKNLDGIIFMKIKLDLNKGFYT
jgi:hypothetical protein